MPVRKYAAIAVVALVLTVTGSGLVGSASRPNEGIGVRGDWTIDVLDPDGSLASHYAFHNDLYEGDSTIAHLLSKAVTAGPWYVELGSASGEEICANPATGLPTTECDIAEPDLAGLGAQSENLEVTSKNIEGTPSVVLSGSVTADYSGSVSFVDGWMFLCEAQVAPDECDLSTFFDESQFSFKAIDSTPIEAGQIVQVEVVYSIQSLP